MSLAVPSVGYGGWGVGVLTSFTCNNSCTYILRTIIILDVTERAREKARSSSNGLSHVP